MIFYSGTDLTDEIPVAASDFVRFFVSRALQYGDVMNGDAELLGRYVAERSEPAFAELIGRHVDLVYSAALRVVNGDRHRAEDVTQEVFTELARQARPLSRHPTLAGWLYTTTRRMGLRVVRTEIRRTHREHEAMNQFLNEPGAEPEWERLRFVLEEAMHELNEKDRLALLLRYFQNKGLKDVGAALGLNENSARMRVERALEKLRAQLARRGVTSSTAALALTLAGKAVEAAPPAFVATLTTASLAGASTGTGGIFTALKLMTLTKAQLGLIGAAALLVAIPLTMQHANGVKLTAENLRQSAELARLDAENARLSNSLARYRRAAAVEEAASPKLSAGAANARSNNLAARLMPMVTNGVMNISSSKLESYLKEQKRSAGSLLAAFRISGDKTLLQEAMEKYPNDPQVGFAAVFKTDSSPEEHRQWLEAFKQSAPDNSIPNYLSALDYFKNGQSAQAVQELSAAAAKGQLQDYSTQFVENGEEAYIAAGYSPAEAETLATSQIPLPQVAQLKELNQDIVDLAKSYRQAGDSAFAQSLLQTDLQLGQRYSEGPAEFLINTLVGIAIQRNALSAMDPGSPYGAAGQTVADQLNQLAQQKDNIKTLVQQTQEILPTMPDEDWINYQNRRMMFGEQDAFRWVLNKYGAK